MDNRSEIREFLASRRAKLTPQQVGLPSYGGKRRVSGPRREEVALLAGVSPDYYIRLERGDLNQASEGVLEALARALQLSDSERMHLYDLARAAASRPKSRRRTAALSVRPSLQRVLDAMPAAPAWVRNGRSDFVAVNRMGRALYAPVFDRPVGPANTARFAFLDRRAVAFYRDWEQTASDIVGVLRAEAGRHPYDRGLTDLVGELSTRSEEFRTRWAAHDVRLHHTGSKQFEHPVVGRLTVSFDAMELPADPGLTLTVYAAEPGSATQEKLAVLASWAAPHAGVQATPAHDRS